MKHALRSSWAYASVVVLGIAVAIGIAGCSAEPVEDAYITISPAKATLRYGQSQTFTAVGGVHYTWSINSGSSNETWAILSRTTGEQVTYTSVKSPVSGKSTQILTCTSVLSEGDTNNAGISITAQAYIYHVK